VKVTVLVAVHNGGRYLREAVESILRQTYRDFELLLIDDASTDGAVGALPLDERIRVLRNDRNLGQVPSLNRGLEEARGAYVARLDADDAMLPERLERQVAVLDRLPRVALVGTWMDVVDEDGRLYAKLRGRLRDRIDLLLAILRDSYPFAHPSLLYRRDVVRSLGGYDATLAPAEDKDLYRRLALAGHEARCLEAPLVRYRRHERQLSQEGRARQLANDRLGQERFLGALAGDEHARALRLLLEDGTGAPEPLDLLLDAAAQRFGLSREEHERLAHGVAALVARRALMAGPPGGPALAWAAQRVPRASALRPLLPLVPPTRAAGHRLRAWSGAPRVEPLRRRARRLRALRWLYARLG
jgi:hypothetical protein